MRWLHSFTSLKCKRRKNLNERRMLIRWWLPRTFVNFAYPEFHSCSVFFALKPTHCAGWVCLLHSHQSKTRPMERSPWALKLFINPNQEVFWFRVFPWLILLLLLLLGLSSVANASAYAFATLKTEPFRVYTLIKIGGMDKIFCFFYWHPLFIW